MEHDRPKGHPDTSRYLYIRPPGELGRTQVEQRRAEPIKQIEAWRANRRSTTLDVGTDNPALKIDLNKGHPALNEPGVWFRRFQRGSITREKLQECDQYWLKEEYETWDTQKLEGSIREKEENYDDFITKHPERGQPLVLKHELELQRQALRRRK